jgi:hypothetical protein
MPERGRLPRRCGRRASTRYEAASSGAEVELLVIRGGPARSTTPEGACQSIAWRIQVQALVYSLRAEIQAEDALLIPAPRQILVTRPSWRRRTDHLVRAGPASRRRPAKDAPRLALGGLASWVPELSTRGPRVHAGRGGGHRPRADQRGSLSVRAPQRAWLLARSRWWRWGDSNSPPWPRIGPGGGLGALVTWPFLEHLSTAGDR